MVHYLRGNKGKVFLFLRQIYYTHGAMSHGKEESHTLKSLTSMIDSRLKPRSEMLAHNIKVESIN